MRGYAGKFLDVNLSEDTINEIKFPESILKEYIGGRGLATKILWNRIGQEWENIDPLGPENILLVLTGPLTGYFPGTKICVSGKSPQSNGIVGSTVAGEFGVDLKCAGYDGIIITGKAEKPSYLLIHDKDVQIRDASKIWGKIGRETFRFLLNDSLEEIKDNYSNYGEIKDPSNIYIGPAGENKTRVAAVVSKYAHGAGYGGYGGVMGSKNLKGIVAKGFGSLPDVNDKESVFELIDEFSTLTYNNTQFRRWGTGGGGYNFGFKTSSEPIRNWQHEWHNEEGYKGEEFDKHWVKKSWSDFGCPMGCLKLAVLKEGKYEGTICDNPDYEFEAFMGTNLGIFNPEDNIFLSYIGNDIGFCGIQGGAVLGFAAELYEKGILTKEDLHGIDLKWGNVEAFRKLAFMIATRTGIGDILAEGIYRAAIKLEEIKDTEVLKYAIHEKGIAIGAHGIRSEEDFISSNISYACSVQGGDHGSGASLGRDGYSREIGAIFNDSGVHCSFATFMIEQSAIFDFYESITGWKLSRQDWYEEKGLRILHLQRAMLLLGGPDIFWKPNIDDDNPERFWEPLPSGPFKGKKPDKNEFNKAKQQYYKTVGWDENGVPSHEFLNKLGLKEVVTKLEETKLL